MKCLLPLLFGSPPGELPIYALEPPPGIGEVSVDWTQQNFFQPTKQLYGTGFPNQVNSVNFAVGWEDGQGTEDDANRAIEALEKAWSALVEQQGWRQPNSSETHLIWVIFNRNLGGTGLTTSYADSNFPDGYPVIYLNPEYSDLEDFWASLSAHEFAHAIQYAYRDYSINGEEPWYWEASAEWQSELALPENNAYGYQSIYYAKSPQLKYSSMESAHQYGMLVLNAAIEEHIAGQGSLKAIWEASEGLVDTGWDRLIADGIGLDIEEIFGRFTQRMLDLDFEDGKHYYAPIPKGQAQENQEGLLAYLGTDYFQLQEDTQVEVEGEAILASLEGIGTSVLVRADELVAVTGLHPQQTAYRLIFAPPEEDSGSTDTQASPGTDDKESISGCSCAQNTSQKTPKWIIAATCILLFQRRTTKGIRS